MYQKIYPLISIGIIQIGTYIENLNNSITLFIFLIQIIIALLTIVKLWKEIKINKTDKTTKQIETEIKRKNKFLISVLTVLKNFKK